MILTSSENLSLTLFFVCVFTLLTPCAPRRCFDSSCPLHRGGEPAGFTLQSLGIACVPLIGILTQPKNYAVGTKCSCCPSPLLQHRLYIITVGVKDDLSSLHLTREYFSNPTIKYPSVRGKHAKSSLPPTAIIYRRC